MKGTSLAPFFGYGRGGGIIARWLNRLLIIFELSAGAGLFYLQYTQKIIPVGNWFLYVYPVIFFIAARLINIILARLCEMAVVLIYGTDDGYEIESRLARKEQERAERRERRKTKKIISKKLADDAKIPASSRIILTGAATTYCEREPDEQ